MKKLILTGLLVTNMYAHANDSIEYRYLEIGYGYMDFADNNHVDGFYLDGAFDLSDRFYVGGFIDNRNLRNLDFDRYGLSLGFHTNGTGTTDFYSEFKVGKLDFGYLNSNTLGLYAGTRTAFTDHLELITKFGITHIDDFNDNLHEAEIKGLYKFTNKQAFTAALENYDGELGAKIGYRFSF